MFRMKDYPKEILVRENIWDVKFVKRTLLNDLYCYGMCDPSETAIYIKMGQTSEERLKTFLHELLHAIEHEYNIVIPHKLVHRLEDPFARFLIDNYMGGNERS